MLSQTEVGRKGQFAVRDDLIRLPSGEEVGYVVVVNPDSVLVVPHFDNGDTILVRQWRHAWNASSWEVPAGTLARGEDPVAGALRELEEEAGLRAGKMSSLGTAHGAAILTGTAHLFLAEGLSETARNLEPYEQDMEVRRLPLIHALEAGLAGEIDHSGSITALARAARALGARTRSR
ncbi:MAG TPA: NUDIX hydrolase [Candidatus Dormibacteraeota bacterium]